MTLLFYIMTFLFMYYELRNIISPQEKIEFDKLDDKEPSRMTWYEMIDYLKYAIVKLTYSLWAIIGLFSSQWLLFIFLQLIGILNKKNLLSVRIDALSSFIILLWILINKFYFHISWDHFIKNLF